MQQTPQGALILQGDKTILLDVHDPDAEEARRAIGPFSELEKSPEHLHTYRITPLSLWNAAAAGLTMSELMESIRRFSRYPVGDHVFSGMRQTLERYGLISLEPGPAGGDYYFLCVHQALVYAELKAQKKLSTWLHPGQDDDFRELKSRQFPMEDLAGAQPGPRQREPAAPADNAFPSISPGQQGASSNSLAGIAIQARPGNAKPLAGVFRVMALDRGTIKQELIRTGWPVQDNIPLRDGEAFPISLKNDSLLRNYQKEAVDSLLGDGRPGLGYGTVVLPCGAGKTVVGIGTMAALGMCTLVLTVNVAAVHQWIRELKDKTGLTDADVGEYTGQAKDIRPITVATYQILTWRPDKEGEFPHFSLLKARNWGLIIYDEVHLLPAPVFRITAEIQALRRLGLTATLVREDGLEGDVFSLVGPKRYDVPWKDMEAQGWIASVNCEEIRVDLPARLAVPYAVAGKREKFRIASENPFKEDIAEALIRHHAGEPTLVIGMFIDQLEELARHLNAPLITGKTPNMLRDELYQKFREGGIHLLVVSKVANFAIDLPDASVAIQVSGSFGSRQEEAQRLGRILRPKARPSHFYTLVSRFTVEEEFSANRQQFLTEQGYRYDIRLWDSPEGAVF